MIRHATERDLEDVIRMGQAFFEATTYGFIGFDRHSAVSLFDRLMGSEDGVLLVAEKNGRVVGMIAGLLYPFYFNNDHITGQEIVWWVDQDQRQSKVGIELIRGLVSWAADKGASSFQMMSLDAIEPERMDKVYRRYGFVPSEHTYIRSLH